jgi:hypothetical protein
MAARCRRFIKSARTRARVTAAPFGAWWGNGVSSGPEEVIFVRALLVFCLLLPSVSHAAVDTSVGAAFAQLGTDVGELAILVTGVAVSVAIFVLAPRLVRKYFYGAV